jgi:hypothetical protein
MSQDKQSRGITARIRIRPSLLGSPMLRGRILRRDDESKRDGE